MDPNDCYRRLLHHLIQDGEAAGVVLSEQEKRILSSDLETARKSLPKIGKALTALLASGGFSDEPFLRFSRETTSAAIYFSRQLLLLESKFVPPTLNGVDEGVQAFINSQEKLKGFSLSRIPSPILRIARGFVDRVLRGLSLEDIHPKQGPGSVSERWTRSEKWEGRSWSKRLDRLYPFEWFFGETYVALPRYAEVGSRLIAVPKDFDAPRIISAEPWYNQFVQQGQMLKLYDWFARSRQIRRSVKLDDQTHNSKYLLGRDPSTFVTVDLSRASDNVPAALVWFLLGGSPNVRKYIFSSRTSWTKWKGRKIPLSCFATMGSAVCFPVETLVFLSLTYAVCRFLNKDSSHSSILDDIRVYGDDIIVPTYASDMLLGVLSCIGMEPNSRKTCSGPLFRESCGVEVFGGVEVTVARNKRFQYTPTPKEDYGPVLHLQNHFARMGCVRAAGFLRSICPWIPIGSDSFSFRVEYEPSRVRGAKVRVNRALQRIEHRVVQEASKPIAWRLPEARLLARLHRDYSEFDRYSPTLRRVKAIWAAWLP